MDVDDNYEDYDNYYDEGQYYDEGRYYDEDESYRNDDEDPYPEESTDYGQPIIFISAHGSVVVDSHPNFYNLSAPQLNAYKHTPVFWLTSFGTVLRNHNYDTSPNRMMNDSIDFIYEKRIHDIETVKNRSDLLSTWTGHIGSKDYTNELGLDPRIEPTIPWDLQDKVTGVQLYTLYGKELASRQLYDKNPYDEDAEPWGIWIYNRRTHVWDPVDGFQEDIENEYNAPFENRDGRFDFTLDDVFWRVEENYGATPIVFSYSCRHLELPDNTYNYDYYLVSEKTMNASIQRRLEEYRFDDLEDLYGTYIVLTKGLLYRILESMYYAKTEEEFDVYLSEYIGLGYNKPSQRIINKYVKKQNSEYGYGTQRGVAGKRTRKGQRGKMKKGTRAKRGKAKRDNKAKQDNKAKRDSKAKPNKVFVAGLMSLVKKPAFTPADFKRYLKMKKKRDARMLKLKKKRIAKATKTRRRSNAKNRRI